VTAAGKSYAFIQDKNEAFIRENLGDQVLITLGINFILFVDTSGQVVHHYFVDLVEGKGEPAPPGLIDKLLSLGEQVIHVDSTNPYKRHFHGA